MEKNMIYIYIYMDCPGSPVDKISPSCAGLIPAWEAKIQQASCPKYQNKKQKQYGNKCNKDFKNGPWPKKKIKKQNLKKEKKEYIYV